MNDAIGLLTERNRIASRALALLMLHGQRGKAGYQPDFTWLEGILGYADRVVRGVHFKDEEALVLRPLRQLRPDLRPSVGRAGRTHVASGGYCQRIGEALGQWRHGRFESIEPFIENSRDHFKLLASHGRLLRGILLPALSQATLSSLAVMRPPLTDQDPLVGCLDRSSFEAALCRFMGRATPPVPGDRLASALFAASA